MFIDGRTLDGTIQEADICIIGAGAAGLTIANRLSKNKKLSIIIAESAAEESNGDAQQLYKGISTGLYYALEETRTRGFGGSTQWWSGMCAPLNESDFIKRDWVPHSGWPFTKSEIIPYYHEASRFLNLSGSQETNFSVDKPFLDSMEIENHCWLYPKNLRMGEVLKERFRNSKEIKVIFNTNITNIETSQNRAYVQYLDAKTIEGQAFRVKANCYVLAGGGIENPRLLLLSRNQLTSGLGNENDLVGRFFMEHPHTDVATLFSFGLPAKLMQYTRSWNNVNVDRKVFNFTPSSIVMKKHRMLNGSIEISTKNWLKDYNKITTGRPLNKPPEIANYLKNVVGKDSEKIYQMTFIARSEQSPNANSRISLSYNKFDSLGLPMTQLNWELTELDWYSVQKLAIILATHISELRLGAIRLHEWAQLKQQWPNKLRGGAHHMGTTRMHDNPRYGVVDRNGRLHGTENLYISGSSIFPTSGWSNPTYTIIAMSLRLADHIESILSRK